MKSQKLEVSTTRMTAPGTASKPKLLSLTGGMVEIEMETPKDLGGYSGGVTGYRVLSQLPGEQEFSIAYDGTSIRETKVILNGLLYGTYYKFVSLGMSYVDYPDFCLGKRPEITPYIVTFNDDADDADDANAMKESTSIADPVSISPLEFG